MWFDHIICRVMDKNNIFPSMIQHNKSGTGSHLDTNLVCPPWNRANFDHVAQASNLKTLELFCSDICIESKLWVWTDIDVNCDLRWTTVRQWLFLEFLEKRIRIWIRDYFLRNLHEGKFVCIYCVQTLLNIWFE